MKLRLNLSLRRCLLAAFAAVATLYSANTAAGSTLYSSVGMQTYADFGQNYGRYQAGRVNAMLSGIRERDGGVKIYYIGDKFADYSYTMEHGMIDFSSSSYASVDAAIGYGFLATVQHNGVQNPSYAAAEVGEAYAVRYAGIEYRNGNVGLGQAADEVFLYAPKADHKITRLSKLVTDARTSDVYNDMSMLGKPLTGQLLYRAGSGTMFMAEVDADGMADSGAAPSIRGAYDYVTGGLTTIDSWNQRETQEGGDFNYSVYHTVNDNIYAYITGTQASGQVNPLPYIGKGGDSGSPSWVWNEAAGQYQYISALQSGGGNFSQDIGAWAWELEKMESFNKNIALGSDSVIHLTGVTALGDTITGNANGTTLTVQQHLGSIVTGGQTTQFAGVQSGVNTWLNLNDIKDNLNWYNYGNEKLNANGDVNKANDGKIVYGELMHTDSIVLKASSATPYTVQLDDTVDTGIGYVRFSKAEGVENATFNLVSEAGEQHQLNSAGFVVDKGVTLDVSLTGDSGYLREWRKVGDGDLRISGSGDNFVLLNVGGGSVGTNDGSDAGHASGKVYLDRDGGYAAYNVLASTGSTVILKNTAQVAHDVTLGAGGATLDLNGNDYTWNNATTADGFTLHMLTEKDILANHGSSSATVIIKDAGASLLGSFEDSASGALNVIYDGGSKSLALHSVFTDLTKNDASGFTVKSGSVSLGGTMTVHGRGSLTGTNADRVENPDDWHYADAAMDVTVQNGGTFTLDSHARLTGDVTVEQGGTFVMKEGTKHQFEYIEGATFTEDTQDEFYSKYHGLKGDIKLQGGELQVAYNAGTDSHNTYAGDITGEASAVSIDLGTEATLSLSGNNNFTMQGGGSVALNSGNVIAENAAAAGYSHDGTKGTAAHKWLVGEQASLAIKGLDGNAALNLIDDASNGVLALTQNQETQMSTLGFYAPDLIVGAMAGERIEYGTQGTTEALEATIGSAGTEHWLLGGGGGELVVNFALQNDDAALVLGNEYTTGSVTLTNESNHFGSITFAGRVTLGYTSEAALGNSHINLAYGHRIVGSESALNNIDGGSTGAMLLDNMAGANVSVATHPTLALGATGDVTYSGTIALGDSDTYRFGAVTGKLALTKALADNGKATHLEVDGQHYSGGVVELKQAATLTGDVTVMGYNSERSEETGGDITLRLGAANALASAHSVSLKDGGILDVNGARQQLNNLSMAAGSTLTDSTHGNGSAVLNVSDGVTTALEGSVDVASLTKTGAGTLNLGGTNSYAQFNIAEGKVALKSNTALQNAGITNVHSGAVLDATAVSTGGQIALSGGELKVGGSLNGVVQAVSGTSTVTGNSSGISEISAEIGTNAGATLTLAGNIIRLTNGNINADSDNGTEIVKSGTLSVTANRLAINNSATADIGGTLSFDSTSDQTLYSNRNGDNTTRNIAHLHTGDNYNKTLHISEETWNTIWNIHALTGYGTLQWDSKTTHWYSSRIVLDGENTFSGTILAKRDNSGSTVRPYASYLELGHDKAAQYAMVNLVGADDNDYMNLAVNTDNASVRSLTGNTYTTLYAGAAFPGVHNAGDPSTGAAGMDAHPVSSRQASLTFTGNVDGNFHGNVYGGENGNGISLVMNAAYDSVKQTFDGETVQLNNVTVQKGQLVLSSTGLNIAGNVNIATGATLKTGSNFSLDAGKTLSVTGGNTATATLNSVLVLNGGTLDFDSSALSTAHSALTVNGVSVNAQAPAENLTLNFSNASYLHTGQQYKLVSGDWSALGVGQSYFNVEGADYLLGTFTMASDGLSVSFAAKNGELIWDGTSGATSWTASQFGQQRVATTSSSTVVFNDSAQSHNVKVSGWPGVGTMVFDNTQDYTISGNLFVNDIHVVGSGATTLSAGVAINSNGSVTVDNGSLIVKGVSTLPVAKQVSGTGTLVLDWGVNSENRFNIKNLHALEIRSGQYTTDSAVSTEAIIVRDGGQFTSSASQTMDFTLEGTGRKGTSDRAALSLSNNAGISGSVQLTGDTAIEVTGGTSRFSGTITGTENTLTKLGSGTMEVAGMEVQGLNLAEGSLVLHRNNAASKYISAVQLGDGTTFTQYSDEAPNALSGMDTLALGGNATMKTDNFAGSLRVSTLKNADGVADATLNLVNNSSTNRYTLFELGRNGAETGNFAGTINLSSTHSGDYRSAALVISKGDITKNAVVNLDSAASSNAKLALGLHDATVTVAGLASGADLGSRAHVYSGYAGVNASDVTKENVVRTLAVNTAADTESTFNGAVTANINIVKTGDGTQNLAGNSSQGAVSGYGFNGFNGTVSVQGGTLGLSDIGILTGASAITVGESGTLRLDGALSLSAPTISNSGTVIFGSNALYTLDESTITTPHTYTLVSGSGTTQDLSLNNFRYNGQSLQGYSSGIRLIQSGGDVLLSISDGEVRTLVWDGTAENSIWDMGSSANWQADGSKTESYAPDSVIFGSGGSKQVSVAAGTSVQDMTIAAGSYSFSGMNNLRVDGDLSINEGASATFDRLTNNQTQHLTADGNVTAGSTTINSGSATFNGSAHFTDGMLIDGGTTTFNGEVTVDDTAASYELIINRGEVAINGRMTVNGNVQLGHNETGAAKANIRIGENGSLSVGTLNSAWGFNTLTVDGVLNTDHMNLSTGTTQTITGSGTINAGHLTGTNAGTYNFSNLRLNIGNGGMDGDQTMRFTNMTLGALDNWTADRSIDLAGAIVIDTAKVGSESSEGATITLKGLNVNALTSLTKTGAGTLVLSNNNGNSGKLIVAEGSLQIGSNQALGSTSGDRIRIDSGATLDINGVEGAGTGYTVTLNGGTLTNTGNTVDSGKRQVVTGLKLTADSAVESLAGKDFGLIAHGWGPTAINLGEHTLEKTGAGTYYVTAAAITGSGKLKVSEGTLHMDPKDNGHLDSGIDMAGGTLSGAVKLGENITMDITKGSVISAEFRTEGHTLTVNNDAVASTMSGALTGAGKLVKTGAQDLTLTNGSANFTGGAEVQQGTLRLNGAAAGMMDRLTSLSVAEDATLHLATSGSFSDKNWDASQVLGNIELGNGTDSMTVNATAFSALNDKATLIVNKNAQYDGNGTGTAPATLNNDLVLRGDATRNSVRNVDVFNGNIAIEGSAIIAAHQYGVARALQFNGAVSGDTLVAGSIDSGCGQQFYIFSAASDVSELEHLDIRRSAGNWTNVIAEGEQSLAKNVTFAEGTAKYSRLFVEADNTIDTLQSAAGDGFMNIAAGASLKVKELVDFGGELHLGGVLNKNSTASGLSVGNSLLNNADYVIITGNGAGKTAHIAGEILLGADDESQTAFITGKNGTLIENALIDLAAGTTLNLTDVTLSAGSKLTDATAYVNVENVTLQAQVGFNAEQVSPVHVASATPLHPSDGAGNPITMTADSSVYSLKLNNVENVQLSGTHLSIALSGVEEETLQPHSLVSIALSGSATYNDSLDVVVTYNGYTAKGYYLAGNDNTVFVTVHDLTTPEPATATLSLLALAALAARRRRR